MPVASRVELQVIGLQTHLIRRAPGSRLPPEMPRIEAPARRLDERRGRAKHNLQQPFDETVALWLRERCWPHLGSPRDAVRIEPCHERIGREEGVDEIAADERL